MTQPPAVTDVDIRRIRARVWRYYRAHGRHNLPFRKTQDSYCVTVSEIMLQQTGVGRVVPVYEKWIARWPNWRTLARATPRQLLSAWSGLGYNRRALYLGKIAQEVTSRFAGELPANPETLRTLSGIGPYTANAIAIFAFNLQTVTIDVNIRRVILSETGAPSSTTDDGLAEIATRLCPRGKSRLWHFALMDYGSDGLSAEARNTYKPKTQGRFVGSRRQMRGAIIRALTKTRQVDTAKLAHTRGWAPQDMRAAALSLVRDGLVILRSANATLTNSRPKKKSAA